MREIARDTQTKILQEQYIPDNVFLYIVKGAVTFFDGSKSHTLRAGESCLARKYRLVKFILSETAEEFEPVLFCFDEEFLQKFQKKYDRKPVDYKTGDAFISIRQSALLDEFIRSLKPYHQGIMKLDEAFEDLKYEELLLILLSQQPELAGILFDYAKPQKINLGEFMNRNYKFNVSLERFACLTGRSLSAFKRDFKAIFKETPNRWLVQKRLQEAYFLIDKENRKSSDIYLDLGFETLSHFSFAFKKQFGIAPTGLSRQKNMVNDL